jgi:type IV pilus assembly protein PilY1
VGALGRGGKGVYGLDVTTPSSFSATNVKWDKTGSAAPADMGQVLGEPLIATLNDTNKTNVAIVSNGMNSSTGTAALFVIKLDDGTVIQELDTGVTGDNGLMAPRGWDDNGDGTVDYVYAGDLKGNLWKFDFTQDTATIALSGSPLFTTASGQPITAGLALARDPASGKRWVFAGSGKFLENGDVHDDTVQSLYGIIDDAPTTTLTRSNLEERDIALTDTVDGKSVRSFESHGPLDGDVEGWFIDLDKPSAVGERTISRPQVKGSVLVVATIIPPTDDSCEAGGSGYINALDAFTGTSTTEPYFDANGDGKVDENDQLEDGEGNPIPVGSVDLGVGMPTLPTVIDKLLVVGGSTGGLGDITVNPQGGAAQRISWREILED